MLQQHLSGHKSWLLAMPMAMMVMVVIVVVVVVTLL